MEESNYIEMLKRLYQDRDNTILKLKAIDAAIEVITPLSENKFIISNSKLTGLVKTEKKSIYEDVVISVPFGYAYNLSTVELLLYALFNKGELAAHDAAIVIYEIDSIHDLNYLKRRFTDIASGLGRAGKLDIRKKGKKFLYSLKEADYDTAKRIRDDELPF